MKVPERRQHVRIVTLRNFGWLTLAMALAFIAISIRSELRGRHMQDYGRLVDRQMQTDIQRKPVEVVEESVPATEAAAAPQSEPMMIEPADGAVQPAPTLSAQVVPPARGDSRVAIVGGPEGVTIVQRQQRRPLLRGGFGR